ncbi:MAG: hypothetical protein WDO74_28290 [Pseudomonadota bacterium]
MYIGNVARFTLRYSYSHDSKVGHLVKSRAAENFITYNRLSSENGSTSYELDLPNLGLSFVIGNLIEQGENGENPSLLSYGLEGTTPGNPKHALYVLNNTFVNDRPSGGTFVNVAPRSIYPDGISLNPARLLFESKTAGVGSGWRGLSPLPYQHSCLPRGYDAEKTIGARIWAMVEGGFASAHDALIANKVAHVLCGGPVAAGTLLPEQHFLDLEREAFLSLCGEPKSQERVQFMLMNNKPLRN